MYVIMGNLSTFTVFQCHIFCQGHVKVKEISHNVYTVMYHRYAKYESDKHNGY